MTFNFHFQAITSSSNVGFSEAQANKFKQLLQALFSLPHASSFLAGLRSNDIYFVENPSTDSLAMKNAFYVGGPVDLSGKTFYAPDGSGSFHSTSTEAGSPRAQTIFVGSLDILNGSTDQPIGNMISPLGTSVDRYMTSTLFHELAHAVTIYNGSHANLGIDNTPYAGVEAVAIAAENYIYHKDVSIPSRIGHTKLGIKSFDPALPFRNVNQVTYKWVPNATPGIGSAAQFSGTDGSSGTISKRYYTNEAFLNYVTVSGDRSGGLLSKSGRRWQTFSDALDGSLASTTVVKADIASLAKSIRALDVAASQLTNASTKPGIAKVVAALSGFDLTSMTNVTALSDERFTDYVKPITVNLVGPADTSGYNVGALSLLVKSRGSSILLGSSGFASLSPKAKGANDDSNAYDHLAGGNGGQNLLIAGSGTKSGAPNLLEAGTAGDMLIGGAGNDSLKGSRTADLFVETGGFDKISGAGGIDTLVLDAKTTKVDLTKQEGGFITLVNGKNKTLISGTEIFVGSSSRTEFLGNGHSILVAGSGGADFHLKSGDIAIGNPNVKGGNKYYVTSTDLKNNHVGIVGLGKNDKLYVDGKLFKGSTALATTLGESYDSNHDGPGNAGVFARVSSSWGASVTQPRLYDTYNQPPEAGLRYHYWINGTDLYNPTPLNLKDVTYVKSADQSGTPAGDIYFTSQTGDGFGGTTVNASLDISVIGWQQGYAGINFHENNLARDTLGALSIGGGIGGWSGQVLGRSGAGAAINPGFYMLGDVLTAVGGLFDPNSSEWQSVGPGQLSAWDQIDQLISAIEDDAIDGADLPDQNPFGPGDDGDGGGGIGGPIGDMPTDDGPSGIAVLQGDASANLLDPEGNYGKVIGGGGGDTIIYDLGYGSITIDEQDTAATPVNVLQFGASIAPDDVAIDATPEGDIVLTVGEDASIVLKGALTSTENLTKGVQHVTFADGTSWSYADMLATLETATVERSAIYGDGGANELDVAGLASSAAGGGGGDTFVFAPGYGAVTIDERDVSGNAANILNVEAGIDPWSAAVTADSDGAITIDFGGGDSVTIVNALLSDTDATYGVQQISFADGTTWSYADLLALADTASSSNRALYGDRSANYLWGGGIARSLTGGGGGDTFEFDRGDRPITIHESDSAAAPANQLTLYGFDSSEISVSANAAGDLLLHADGVVQVTIAGALNSDGQITRGVQNVLFGDGTVWSYSDLLTKADTASSDNIELFGDGLANLFNPEGLATSVVGGGGGDTILYQRGYGALSIVEADASAIPANTLEFGADIGAADVMVAGNAAGDLILSLGNGDTVTLVGALLSGSGITNGVQTISFADGTSWTYADLLQKALTPSAGGPIVGDTSSNIIDSGGIAAVAIGNGGNDTFVYDAGYGALTIDEEDNATTANNVLALGTGISPSAATLSAMADDIILSFGGSDTITLAEALQSNDIAAFGVQSVQFADGTSWSYADLLAKLATPTSDGTIFGDRSANEFDTAGLANKIVGGGGGDTVIFNQGYGQVTITEDDRSGKPDNLLLMGAGIDPSQVTVSGTAAGGIIIDAGNGDSIVLEHALRNSADSTYGVEQVVFQDGTIWSYDDLLTKIETPSTTNTTLYGDTGANILDGAGIASWLVGNGGDDTFIYQQGYGALTIDEQDAGGLPDNRLVLGAGILATDVDVSANASGDLILTMTSGDVVTLKNALASGFDTAFGVQEVAFDDGTVWSYTDLVDLAAMPSPSQTTLYGDHYANTFDSAGVANQIVGGGGGDDFFYARGYGALSIDERDVSDMPSNSLTFGAGITPDDVTVSVSAAGDILLSLGNGDVVTLTGGSTAMPGLSIGVQQVRFDGGLSWDAAQVQAFVLGAWTVVDDGGSTEIDEATNFGASTPVLNLAFASTDTAVSLSEDRQSLILTSVNNTVVTIEGLLRTGAGAGQIIDFSDGVSWSLDYAMSQASNTADVINYEAGTPAAESFNFAGGIREVIGFGGGDRIRYDVGDGFVTVDEADSSASPDNVLVFGPGVGLSDLIVTSDGHDLYLKLPDGDQVVVANALMSDATTAYGVQRVTFDDGSSATYADLLAIADTGSVDNSDTLFGDANANVIDPAGYSHEVHGNGGGDTII